MPALSMPTTHSASLPRRRSERTSTSCNVLSSAWPMCSAPVTFGGGLTIVNGVASGRAGRNSPRLSHSWAHFARSEEHTSELQSLMRLSYAVFCLKKKKNLTHHHCITIERHSKQISFNI